MPRLPFGAVISMSGALACAITVSAPAAAQNSDSRSRVTFSARVTVAGVTLPAGTYAFTLTNMRERMLVFDEMNQLVANAAIIRVQRKQPGATILFRKSGPTASAAVSPEVSAWYSDGGVEGFELLPLPPKRQRTTAAQIVERRAK